MIFIGYSSKDRYEVVEPITYHLKNYGFKVWYDFHDMYLSDDRNKANFEYGIGESQYVIIILSPNFFLSSCAIEELDFALKLYEKNEITLFPILFNIKSCELPLEYSWIRKIIYNEISTQTGTLFVTNQIIEKILHDELFKSKYRSFSEVSKFYTNKGQEFLNQLLETFIESDCSNYSSRMALLYSLYLYIVNSTNYNFPTYLYKTINRIYNFTKLNVSLDHLSYSIFEKSILLLFNYFIQLNQQCKE